jgi:hypothetical protein
MRPTAALEFIQAKDGTLYGRTTADASRTPIGGAAAGARIDVPGGFTFAIDEFLPYARREISYTSARSGTDIAETFEPAVKVEVSVAETTKALWLRRNNRDREQQQIETQDGLVHLEFGNEPRPLGFSLHLVDCSGDSQASGKSACGSSVRLIDENSGVDIQRQISKRDPLVHEGLKIIPSESYDAGHGREAAAFRVVYRPGALLKSAGAWTMFLSVAMMLCMRAASSHRSPRLQ